MGVPINDLELNPRRGRWYIQLGVRGTLNVDKERFLCSLKASHIAYNESVLNYGEESLATQRAKRKMNFYYGQIDEDTSDIMTLLMFDPTEWDV